MNNSTLHAAIISFFLWSSREAAEIFQRHGLTGPVWALAEESERF